MVVDDAAADETMVTMIKMMTMMTVMLVTMVMVIIVMVMPVIMVMVVTLIIVMVVTVIHHQIIMVALPFTSSFALLVIGRLFQVINIVILIIGRLFQDIVEEAKVAFLFSQIMIKSLPAFRSINSPFPFRAKTIGNALINPNSSDNGTGGVLYSGRLLNRFPHRTREVETLHNGFSRHHRSFHQFSFSFSPNRSWIFGRNVPRPTVPSKLRRNISG